MGGAVDQPRHATVWMDVTTSWRSRAGPTNGTLRVEQSYAAALQKMMPERLRLSRYHPTRRRFIPIDALPNVGASEQATPRRADDIGCGSAGIAGIGRRMEQRVRHWRRSATAGIYRWLDAFGDISPFPDSRPG